MADKAALDPALTPDGLRLRAADYLATADAADPLASSVFAELTDLAPLLIQAGSHEILLDDATRLAARAAAAHVAVTVDVTPGVAPRLPGIRRDPRRRGRRAHPHRHLPAQSPRSEVATMPHAADPSSSPRKRTTMSVVLITGAATATRAWSTGRRCRPQ
jgi:acetyl esterase/lipase